LDTVPFNGTTTTCEALWMGVPVVSLAGQTHASRVGLSILSSIGQAEWVAQDRDEYEAIAIKLASDPQKLGQLRAGMRDLLKSSPLMDEQGFARDFQAAIRTMWRNWCESAPAAG
jgi:protein O-GlcNAc transferase